MTDFATRRRMMVDTQVRPSDVTKFPIIDAMLRIPREIFVPDGKQEAAYAGRNVRLGDGRVVLEPRTLSKMLDAINIDDDDLVLDIGTGMGYSSAVIARIAEAVVAVEDDESLAAVIAEFERASQKSREIAARFDLDDTKDNPREGTVSMRWTLLAMIQEFARHAGHGDILREQIDRPIPTGPSHRG